MMGMVHPTGKRDAGKPRPAVMLALIAAAELLGLTLWFSATAVAGPLVAEFGWSTQGAAWLTMAVQAGFVAGTLASGLLNLPDLVNPRSLFALGTVAGAASNAAVAVAAAPAAAIAWRFATGAALASVYPPGLKIAAGWTKSRRGTALGLVVGALTLGSAAPHLLAWLAPVASWRAVVLAASALALAGGAIVRLLVRDGPHVVTTAPFDPRAAREIFQNARTRLATLGYLGHMWELYACWTWMAAFAAAGATARGVAPEPAVRWGSIVAFVAVASGAPACVAAGVWGDRIGKARIARLAMIGSGGCALASGAFFEAPPPLFLALAVMWGTTVIADSAQFSALVADATPSHHVGTALTLQTCVGFLLTMLPIRLVPALAAAVGWQWTFLLLAPGPLLGTIAMRRLQRLPDFP
jgi:MFS family permease